MAQNTFTPTPNIQQPSTAYSSTGQAFGLPWANPEGSDYASIYSKTTTALLRTAIENKIYDTTNKQYAAFWNFWYGRPMLTKPSSQFNFFERGFGRVSLEVFTWTSSGGTNLTGTIHLAANYTEANDIGVTVGDTITAPVGNRPFVVTDVIWVAGAGNSTIKVSGYNTTANTVAADFIAGDILAFQAANGADGTNSVNHYDRMGTIKRYNFMQKFERGFRFGKIEMQEWLNNGTTDYLPQNKQNTLEQIRTDMFSCWLNGTRGEFSIPAITAGVYYAKAMGGVYPSMIAAGAASTSVTQSGIVPAFKALTFATNTLAKGATRFVLGTDESLDTLSTAFKNPVMYAPNDKVASLGLTQYDIGTSKIVPIVTPMMGDSTIFPQFFSGMLLCVNMDSMNPTQMEGIPAFNMFNTKSIDDGTNLNAYSDFIAQGHFGMQFNNPGAGFIVHIL